MSAYMEFFPDCTMFAVDKDLFVCLFELNVRQDCLLCCWCCRYASPERSHPPPQVPNHAHAASVSLGYGSSSSAAFPPGSPPLGAKYSMQQQQHHQQQQHQQQEHQYHHQQQQQQQQQQQRLPEIHHHHQQQHSPRGGVGCGYAEQHERGGRSYNSHSQAGGSLTYRDGLGPSTDGGFKKQRSSRAPALSAAAVAPAAGRDREEVSVDGALRREKSEGGGMRSGSEAGVLRRSRSGKLPQQQVSICVRKPTLPMKKGAGGEKAGSGGQRGAAIGSSVGKGGGVAAEGAGTGGGGVKAAGYGQMGPQGGGGGGEKGGNNGAAHRGSMAARDAGELIGCVKKWAFFTQISVYGICY